MSRAPKIAQVWECPKCGKRYEAPLPVAQADCYDSSHARAMKLIEGEPLKRRKRRVKRSAQKQEPSRPYEGKANTEDLKKILEDIRDGS